MSLTRRSLLLQVAAGITLPTNTRAHHGFGGRYDASRSIYLEGVVRAASVRPPHPTIQLDVAQAFSRPASLPDGREFEATLVVRDEDRGGRLEVEFPPVRMFFDLGHRLAVGDTVSVIVLRNCAAPHQLRGQWIRLAGGQVAVRSGRVQTEVSGCPSF